MFTVNADETSETSRQNSQSGEIAPEDHMYCRLDTSPIDDDSPIKVQELSQVIRQFRLVNISEHPGVKVEIDSKGKKLSATLWNRAGEIVVLLEGGAQDIRLTTSYPDSMKKFQLRLSPNIDLKCMNYEQVMALEEGAERMSVDSTLHADSDLHRFGRHVEIEVTQNLRFPFSGQGGAGDKMRFIVFQRGQTLQSMGRIDRNHPWCAFQIEIKRDEDTVIQRRTKFSPVSVSRTEARSQVISYNFVDFSTGRRGFDHPRFTPFTLECSIGRDEILTPKLLEEISGGRIAVHSTL